MIYKISYKPRFCLLGEEQCMPHCWNKTVLQEVDIKDGLLKKEIYNETDCKELCGRNQTCIGVYWGNHNNNSNESSCWFKMPFHGVVVETLTNVGLWSLTNCTGTVKSTAFFKI